MNLEVNCYAERRSLSQPESAHKRFAGPRSCLLAYDDREQQVTAIAQYVKAGLELGEKCIYVSDKDNADFVLHVLKDTGLDVERLSIKAHSP